MPPLKPMSEKKRAELAAQGVVFPTSTLRPVSPKKAAAAKASGRPLRPKPTTNTGPDRLTVDAVLERDMHSCVVCGLGLAGVRGVDWSIHHRIRRSQGLDNTPPNLISVCGNGTQGHHGAIHAEPGWAREFGGWLLRGTETPLVVPVLIDHGSRWVYLTADGSYSSLPPEAAA
jgi:hypothetical protein